MKNRLPHFRETLVALVTWLAWALPGWLPRLPRLLEKLILVLFTAEQRRDMLELLDDRYGQRPPLVTSQMPVENWHELISDPTLADTILDRLVHKVYGSSSRANQCVSRPRN